MSQAVSQKVDPDDLSSAADAFQQKTGRAPTDEDKTKLGLALLARGGDVDAAVSAAMQPAAAPQPAQPPPKGGDVDADPNVKNLNDWANVGTSIAHGVSSAAGAVGDALSSMGHQGADALRADMSAGYAGDVQVTPGKPRSIKSAVQSPATPAAGASSTDTGSMTGAAGSMGNAMEPTDDFVHADRSAYIDPEGAKSIADKARENGGFVGSPGATPDGVPWSIAVQTVTPGHIQEPKDLHAESQGIQTEKDRFEQAIGAKPGEGDSTLNAEEKKIAADWQQKKNDLTATFNDAKERLGWMEAVTLLSTGLARLGAGLYGMRTGVDVSGMKFDYYDWSKDYARLIDETKMKLESGQHDTEIANANVHRKMETYKDINNRLGAAQGREAGMETQIAEGNARMGQEAAQFNAGQQNSANQTQARFAFDNAELDKRLSAEITMAGGRSVRDAAKEDYRLRAQDFQKRQDSYQAALSTLSRVASGDLSMSDPKEKATVDQAFKDVGSFVDDPHRLADDWQKSKSSFFTMDKTHMQNFLDKLRAEPVKQPPSWKDYTPGSAWYSAMTSRGASGGTDDTAGAGGPPQTPAPNVGPRSTTDARGRTIYQWPNGQWSTAKPPQ
jgi:hypothetical protein